MESPDCSRGPNTVGNDETLYGDRHVLDNLADQLLGLLRGVPEVYGADARPKTLEWMIRQAKSIAGK